MSNDDIQVVENQPNTWASLVKKNFEPGVIFKVEAKNKVKKNHVHHKLIDSNLEEVKRIVDGIDDHSFHMFSDAYDWRTNKYLGLCEDLEGLVDSGNEQNLIWWHGYNFERDMVVQFEYDTKNSELYVKYRLNLNDDYISSVKQAITN